MENSKIDYNIITTIADKISVMADTLLDKVKGRNGIMRLVFFGKPESEEEYVRRYEILKSKVKSVFGEKSPIVSYVSQPALDCGLVMEVHSFYADKEDQIEFKTLNNDRYILIKSSQCKFILAGGLHGSVKTESYAQQAENIFSRIADILNAEGFKKSDIVRQWNYIPKITEFSDDKQNYQVFNDIRSKFYSDADWTNGYPAATGIGMSLGSVLIDFDAMVPLSQNTKIIPINNSLQIAAHKYSDSVLISPEEQVKTTPKFERAKFVTEGSESMVYISGTAAIRGEESLSGVGIEKQIEVTMENIHFLISKDNLIKSGVENAHVSKLAMLRIYLKHAEDLYHAKKSIDDYHLNIPISYLLADICRDELLVEIEGIANK